ncbi:MAG: hypothetical protein Alis3KO_02930 [Aliiglaciecola sp.]
MRVSKDKRWFKNPTNYLLGAYCIAVLLFFLAELKLFGLDQHLRATNQVLILFALLIMPFVIINMPSFIQSLTLRVSDKEFHVQLHELKSDFKHTINRVQQQVSTSEQSLWPMLAGEDILADQRLSQPNPELIIGTKSDPSQLFLSELLALAINHVEPDIRCVIRYPNGDSMHNFAELKYRWIDLYMDFTGTCIQYFNISHTADDDHTQCKSDEEIIETLNVYGQNLGIEWFPTLGCSEDYCLVMTEAQRDEHQIETLSDLKTKARNLVISADPEFINRQDCLLGLDEYGINFKSVLPCGSDRYAALKTEEAQVFTGYESDPQLTKGQVVALQDTENFFPRYMALPMVSSKLVAAFPKLRDGFALLQGCMNTEDLNAAVSRITAANYDVQRAKAEALAIFNRTLQKKRVS